MLCICQGCPNSCLWHKLLPNHQTHIHGNLTLPLGCFIHNLHLICSKLNSLVSSPKSSPSLFSISLTGMPSFHWFRTKNPWSHPRTPLILHRQSIRFFLTFNYVLLLTFCHNFFFYHHGPNITLFQIIIMNVYYNLVKKSVQHCLLQCFNYLTKKLYWFS